MSLMLVYFEAGKPVDIIFPELPLVSYWTSIRLRTDGPARQAIVITDGHSSERFLAYGQKVIAREGEKLRKTFVEFIAKRLAAGVDPHFVFVTLSGPIGAPICFSIEEQIDARLTDVAILFPFLKQNQLVRVIR